MREKFLEQKKADSDKGKRLPSKEGGRDNGRPSKSGKKDKGPRPSDEGLDINDPVFGQVTKMEGEPLSSGIDLSASKIQRKAEVPEKERKLPEGDNPGAKEEDMMAKFNEILVGNNNKEGFTEKDAEEIIKVALGKDVFERTEKEIIDLETGLLNTYLQIPGNVGLANFKDYPSSSKRKIAELSNILREKGVTEEELKNIKEIAIGVGGDFESKRKENKEQIGELSQELRNTVKYRRPDLGLKDNYPGDKVDELKKKLLEAGATGMEIDSIAEQGIKERDALTGDRYDKLIQAEDFWQEDRKKQLYKLEKINLGNVELSRRETVGGKSAGLMS